MNSRTVLLLLSLLCPSFAVGQVTLMLQSSVVAVNSVQSLLCTVDSPPSGTVQFKWLFNDQALNVSSLPSLSILLSNAGSQSTLKISPVGLGHSGEYECEVQFTGGAVERSGRRLLEVKSPPDVQANSSQFAVKGEVGRIECQTAFATEVLWFKLGSKIVTDERYRIDTVGNRSQLVFRTGVIQSDAGIYQCSAHNEVGSTVEEITLSLLVRPVNRVLSSNVSQAKGLSYSVVCQITEGSPTPTLSWSFKGRSVTSLSTLSNGNLQSILTVAGAGFKDAGTYVCTATNAAGTASVNTALTVTGTPEVTVSPSTLLEGVSKSVQLTCTALGYPVIESLKWKRNGQVIINSSKFEIRQQNSTSFVLSIRNLTASEADVYVCEAVNSIGPGSDTATLQVIEPPAPPTNLFIMGTPTTRTANISWTPPTSSSHVATAPEHYTIVYQSDDHSSQTQVVASVTQVALAGLHPGSLYGVTVSALNKGGASASSNILSFTTLPSVPSIQDLTVSSVNGRVAVVEWVLEYDGGANITSAVLEYRTDGQDWRRSNEEVDVRSGKHCVTGLTPMQDYSFRLVFGNQHGSSEPLVSTITTPIGVPAAPTVPVVAMETSSSANLRFSFADFGLGRLVAVVIDVSGDGVRESLEFSIINEININEEVKKTLIGLTTGREYRFSVAGRNSAGLGEFSDESAPITLEVENLLYYIIAGSVGGAFLLFLLICCCVTLAVCCRRKNQGQFELEPSKGRSTGTIREPLPSRSELVADGESRPPSGARRHRRFSDHTTPFSIDDIPREAPPYAPPPSFVESKSRSNSYANFKEQLLIEDNVFYSSDWNLKDGSQPDGFNPSQNCSTDV